MSDTERPSEPYTTSEDPERWAEIAWWESEQAEAQLKPRPIAEWHEDDGDVILLRWDVDHLEACMTNPNCSDYEAGKWTHFLKVDTNPIIEKMILDQPK